MKHNIVGQANMWFFVPLDTSSVPVPLALWAQSEDGLIYGLVSDEESNSAGLTAAPKIDGSYKYMTELNEAEVEALMLKAKGFVVSGKTYSDKPPPKELTEMPKEFQRNFIKGAVGDDIEKDFANCHGNELKKQLVEFYDIKPIRWARLINGQSVQGCCLDSEITEVYYEFEAKAKSGNNVTRFQVGKHCAKQFLDLIGWGDKPIVGFDPYAKNQNPEMTNLNREVWAALNLILASMKIIKFERSDQQKTIEYISRFYNKDTADWSIESLLKFLERNKLSLDGMVAKLGKAEASFPKYEFPLIRLERRTTVNY